MIWKKRLYKKVKRRKELCKMFSLRKTSFTKRISTWKTIFSHIRNRLISNSSRLSTWIRFYWRNQNSLSLNLEQKKSQLSKLSKWLKESSRLNSIRRRLRMTNLGMSRMRTKEGPKLTRPKVLVWSRKSGNKKSRWLSRLSRWSSWASSWLRSGLSMMICSEIMRI